jgi:hypothetical protein
VARIDHKHTISVGTTSIVTLAAGNSEGAGSADTVARADHVHALQTGAVGSMVTALNATSNAVGTSAGVARVDHRHKVTLKMNSLATANVKFQLYKAQAEILTTAPSAGTGRMYYNSTDGHIYVYVP